MSSNLSKPTAVRSPSDLPPSRDKKGIRPVSPPLSNVSMHRFNYYMALAAALLLGFYAWRLTVWKAEAGGWWNLALGKQPPAFRDDRDGAGSKGAGSGYVPPVTQAYGDGNSGSGSGRVDMTVEERINELASALGMPSTDLASAIAVAVREYVPPATISSISAHQTGSAVNFIVDPSAAASSQSAEEAVQATVVAEKGFKAAAKAFEAAVGMEEPPSELS